MKDLFLDNYILFGLPLIALGYAVGALGLTYYWVLAGFLGFAAMSFNFSRSERKISIRRCHWASAWASVGGFLGTLFLGLNAVVLIVAFAIVVISLSVQSVLLLRSSKRLLDDVARRRAERLSLPS